MNDNKNSDQFFNDILDEQFFIKFLTKTKQILAERLIMLVDINYKQYCENNNIIIIEQLNNGFFNKEANNTKEITLLSDVDNYSYDHIVKELINLNPSNEQLSKIVPMCFFDTKINLLIYKLPVKNLDIIYDFLNTRQYGNIDDVTYAIDNIHDKFKKDGKYFNIEKLNSSLQQFLKNNHHVLLVDPRPEFEPGDPDDFKFDEDGWKNGLSHSEQIIYLVKKMLPKEVWHEFTPLLPTLIQREENKPLFIKTSNPIIEMSIDNGAMLGKFKTLMEENDIHTLMVNIIDALSDVKLSGIDYIRKISNDSDEKMLLIIKSSTENIPNIDNVEKLLTAIMTLFIENPPEIETYNEFIKAFITKEWLDIHVPVNNEGKNLPKKKI